ncbi:patatin-like phospholipase family protein [Winogradskyella sp.]|jgi:patatin-like phospholipase/acyl hydrolase|uniref:patatin-like phospholipase family protein n=1 Tax=Winogradskyella sp. TaxID=1883156 RepID=UPI0025CBA4A5|nr:patatin-like phospholipase family protein [Winogradskyella sp.]MCT4628819.1 patatin-like phospholipase family protein [Winogradskyella sp.]
MKRILSLDGGGIRGALTLGYLEKIEKTIQEKENNPKLKIYEYFDLIGGTSTGAIIAAGLCIGMTASEIKDLYLRLGDKIFGKKRRFFKNPFKWYKADYDYKPLEEELKKVFRDYTLGSDQIKTSLCIITKRIDTLSTWPLTNHPKAKYYEKNKGILLYKLIRASTAAPTYFQPQKINVGANEIGTFIDGGVSLANNPSLQLFLLTTLKGFPYNWETGANNLSIYSIGTGTSTKRYNYEKMLKKGKLGWARLMPEIFMEDANYLNQTLLQYMSQPPSTSQEIDREIGNLKNDNLTSKPLLHYIRYNVLLDENELNDLGYTDLTEEHINSLREMSESKNKELLYEIGSKAAEREVKIYHFK